MSTDEEKRDAGTGRRAVGRAAPPWSVKWAIALLWVNAAINAVDVALLFAGITTDDGSSRPGLLVAFGVGLVVTVLLTVFLWRGARWARWAAGVYLVLGIVVNAWGVLTRPPLPELLVFVASGLVLLVAAFLLLNEDSSTTHFSRD